MYRTWSYTGRTVPSPTGKLELLPHNTAMLLDLHNHNLMINLYQVRQNPGPPNSWGLQVATTQKVWNTGPLAVRWASATYMKVIDKVGTYIQGPYWKATVQVATVIIGNSNWIYWLEEPGPPTPSRSTVLHKLSESHIVTQIRSFICIFLPLFWSL